jgi:hypothetical protein
MLNRDDNRLERTNDLSLNKRLQNPTPYHDKAMRAAFHPFPSLHLHPVPFSTLTLLTNLATPSPARQVSDAPSPYSLTSARPSPRYTADRIRDASVIDRETSCVDWRVRIGDAKDLVGSTRSVGMSKGSGETSTRVEVPNCMERTSYCMGAGEAKVGGSGCSPCFLA